MLKKQETANTGRASRPFLVLSMTIAAIVLTACTKKQAQELGPDPDGGDEPVTVTNVSYNNFAKALLEAKCSSCHAARI